MPRLFAFLAIMMLYAMSACAQSELIVMEWNVENLFDTQHNEGKEDENFLPDSGRRWTKWRFNKKLNDIGRTLAAIGYEQLPDIVVLCEVENDSVMHSLLRHSTLWAVGYEYVMTNSNDTRGINVAMMYRPETFSLITHKSIRPDYTGLPPKRSRDILYASGRVLTGDTLDVIGVHLPSKLDPRREGKPYRLRECQQIRLLADSIMRKRNRANIIITGDFNDSPSSKALTKGLRAIESADTDATTICRDSLYNLTSGKRGQHKGVDGTYCHKGMWETIDNMIVNGQMLTSDAKLSASRDNCYIADEEFLLDHFHGAWTTRRTYNGYRYTGGISDHLPLVLRLRYSW